MTALQRLLDYFDRLSDIMDKIYPEKLTWDNVLDYDYNLDIKHPGWVKSYFPLIMIYHKEKAGKLRDSKNIDIMFQNNQNIMTQVVMTPDDFGLFHRKNVHKGFKNIVAALSATEDDLDGSPYYDLQKPKKYKNFFEFGHLYDPEDKHLQIACEELDKAYPCDSIGQIRLF